MGRARVGRKSSADLAVVVVAPGQRVAPPDGLEPETREQWLAIVNSLPADYFRPADVSLLAVYCKAAAMHKAAADHVAADGMLLEDSKGRMYAHPAVQIMQSTACTLAQIATKLRLCPQSRMPASGAATKTPKSNVASQPWAA